MPRLPWMIVVTCAAIMLAAVVQFGLPAMRQYAAIEQIHRLHGQVGTVRHRPEWLRRAVGIPAILAFEQVDFVNWERAPISDGDLERLRELPTLRRLNLRYTPITDAGLRRLKTIRGLQQVLHVGSSISDDAIDELQTAIPGLRVAP